MPNEFEEFIIKYVSTVIAGLSFFTCFTMICCYQRLPQKSVIMKIIFSICLFDFLFELFTGLLILLPSNSHLSGILGIVIAVIFLSSILTSTSLARIAYHTLTIDIYDASKDFFCSLFIIYIFTTVYILIPLTNNGIIVYQSFASMGFYASVHEKPLINQILAYTYINLPGLISIGIISYCYYKINQLARDNNGDSSTLIESQTRVHYLYVYVGWQLALLIPLVAISNISLSGHNVPDWVLYIDVILTRAAGLVNCFIYFFIRIKKPDMLRNTRGVKDGIRIDYSESFLVEAIAENLEQFD
jgi:hypothetical protein